MKNYAALILSVAVLVGAGLGFSSCKDDEPPVPPKLSFSESAITVNEDVGVIDVELVLDKPYSRDLNVEYTLGGTASDQDAVGTANADYEVVGTHGVVVIESGATSGTIKLEIYSDAAFEDDETIEISIIDVNTSDVQLTTDDEIVITITNDDAQAVVVFGAASLTVNEADGLVDLVVELNNPASSDLIVNYTVEGSALDSLTGVQDETPPQFFDYKFVTESFGELEISAGETSGSITIKLFSDFYFEGDETIVLTLTGSSAASIGTANKMTVTIEQEDGKAIGLLWDPSYEDVDMDLFLWWGEDIATTDNLLALAIAEATEPQEEIVFIPKAVSEGITDLAFGLSYVYYQGTADPMNFEAHFVDFANGEFEAAGDRDVFTAAYTLQNINPWFESKVDPQVVQTFRIVNGEYIEITEITVPASGSRMKSYELPRELQRANPPSTRRLPL